MALNDVPGADIFNKSIADANTDILPKALKPNKPKVVIRVTVSVDAAVKFRVTEKRGDVTNVDDLKDGDSLPPDALQTFVFGASSLSEYNFRLSGAAKVKTLKVEEVLGGVI